MKTSMIHKLIHDSPILHDITETQKKPEYARYLALDDIFRRNLSKDLFVEYEALCKAYDLLQSDITFDVFVKGFYYGLFIGLEAADERHAFVENL